MNKRTAVWRLISLAILLFGMASIGFAASCGRGDDAEFVETQVMTVGGRL